MSTYICINPISHGVLESVGPRCQNCGFGSHLKFGPNSSKIVDAEIYKGKIPWPPLPRATKSEQGHREPSIFFLNDRNY